MPQHGPLDIPALLGRCDPSNLWYAGMSVVTRSGETIEGISARVEGDAVVISTSGGERSVPIAEIVDLLSHAASPGPE